MKEYRQDSREQGKHTTQDNAHFQSGEPQQRASVIKLWHCSWRAPAVQETSGRCAGSWYSRARVGGAGWPSGHASMVDGTTEQARNDTLHQAANTAQRSRPTQCVSCSDTAAEQPARLSSQRYWRQPAADGHKQDTKRCRGWRSTPSKPAISKQQELRGRAEQPLRRTCSICIHSCCSTSFSACSTYSFSGLTTLKA